LKGAKFIFNVSDLWPESAEKLEIVSNRLLLAMATRLEEFLYRKSFLITGQTQGIVKNISERFPAKKVHWLPNGIDEEQFQNHQQINVRKELGFSNVDFLLIYAGIIGHAQGLDVILNAAQQLKQEGGIKFIVVGDGPEKENLLKQKEDRGLDNVIFFPSVAKAKALDMVYSSDAVIVPLKKLELFLGALPSKIFEGLMLEKPLLLGVDGEARQLFITEAKAGIYFEPGNAQQLSDAITMLVKSRDLCMQLGVNGKSFVTNNFGRKKITKDFLFSLMIAGR
jgi:glycosyltransferase involved in cell wall biosynthesis